MTAADLNVTELRPARFRGMLAHAGGARLPQLQHEVRAAIRSVAADNLAAVEVPRGGVHPAAEEAEP